MSPKSIIAQVILSRTSWQAYENPEELAVSVLCHLRENGWRLVSTPVLTVAPDDSVDGFVRGVEDMRLEGQCDERLICARRKIHPQLPDGMIDLERAAITRAWLDELGQRLGLPL
jgi:hypothetical protein